jgi:hypothetical protein
MRKKRESAQRPLSVTLPNIEMIHGDHWALSCMSNVGRGADRASFCCARLAHPIRFHIILTRAGFWATRVSPAQLPLAYVPPHDKPSYMSSRPDCNG